MGFLSSWFQTGAPSPQVAGPTIATTKIPEELAPYYKDILGKAQALYNEKTAEGYKPYTGPTMADFSPEQQQAFTGIAGLQGQQAPVFQEGMQMTREAAAPMTQEQLTSYMSPYQQAVTDIEKREATKLYESQVQPQLAAQAAKIQPFGGSRQAILEGMAADTQQRLLGDIQAKGSQQSYQDAIKRFAADRTAQGQAGAQLAQMAPNLFKAQLGELGAMQTVGEQKQAQSQTALDEAFRQYALEQNYPYDTMSKYQSVVTGAPLGRTEFAPPAPRTPSTAQTLMGGIGTLANAYGMFTGQPASTLWNRAEGGGIADTMVYAEGGGGLNSLPIVYAADGTEDQTIWEKMTGGFKKMVGGVTKFYDENMNLLDVPDTFSEGKEFIKDLPKKEISKFMSFAEPASEATLRREKNQALIESMGLNPDRTEPPLIAFDNPQPGDRSSLKMVPGEEEASGMFGMYGERGPDRLARVRRDQVAGEGQGYGLGKRDTRTLAEINAAVKPVDQQEPIVPVPEGLASLTQPGQPLKPPMPKQIERDYAGEATRMAEARLDKNIGEKETAYLKTITDKQAKLTERGEGLEGQRKQEQYLNMAKFFARLGTVSPRKEGFMGLIDSALQVAPESLDAMAATNDKIRERKETLEDKTSDLESLLRKEELGIVLTTAERQEKRRLERNITTNTNRTFDLEEKKIGILEKQLEADLKIAESKGTVKAGDHAELRNTFKDMRNRPGLFLKPELIVEATKLEVLARQLLVQNGSDTYYNEYHNDIVQSLNALYEQKKTSGGGNEEELDSSAIKK